MRKTILVVAIIDALSLALVPSPLALTVDQTQQRGWRYDIDNAGVNAAVNLHVVNYPGQ